MAIVEMKHMDMLALDGDKQALLNAIQKLGCVQLLPADAEDVTFNRPTATAELPALEETVTRVVWAIGRLHRYDTEKKPFMGDKPAIDTAQADALLEELPRYMQTVEKLESLEREAGELRGQTSRLDAAKEQLNPWRGFALPLDQVRSTRNTVAMLGSVQKSALEQWLADGSLTDLCVVEPVSYQRDLAYVYVVYHRAGKDQLLALLKDGGYTAIVLPQTTLTAEEQLNALASEQAVIDSKQAAVIEATAALAGDIAPLKRLYDALSSKRARLTAAKNFSQSERTFFVQSWVPAPMAEQVEKRLKAVSPTASVSFYDALEGEEPPVLLHNGAVVTPFESVVSSFSMPSPYSVDPTMVMMPFFINFMGMMVSDAGYGLMMAIIAPLLIKLLKPAKSTQRMLWLIAGGGVMTVFWGAMYNTWFGFAPFPSVFDPMNNALPVMATCIGLGALHLFAGLGMAAYLNIRRGKFMDMVYDQLSWFLLIVGLVLLAFAPEIGKWMALVGAGIILVMAGREKSKNPIKRLISGFGALYGITGWVSDLLSYIRLFGMGLATGVIGMVINILVGMVAGGGVIGAILSAVVFVGGHLFNAGINIFGAYVHSCRLQYNEFFGKFFEDGGKPLTPLTQSNHYVYIREAQTRA